MQIDPLVKPRSIAIVGATDRVGPARSVIESLGAIGFAGPIYPVNPKYQTVRNLVCYPSLTDLPEAPDVVVFSIRKPLLPEQVRLAVKRGARAAVIYDAGYAELGEEGARQQAEIAGLCRDASTLPKKMFESIRLESDPVIAVVSTLLTGAVLLGVLISLFFRQRPPKGERYAA